jgi:hypothetical protein
MDVPAIFEERYWYPEDGGEVWLAGYTPVHPDTGDYLGRNAPQLQQLGLRIASVAGAGKHHSGALASDAAAPGQPLRLRRDAGNEHDANAIAVDTAAGEPLGFVPRELAAELAPRIDAGERWSAVALRESRPSPRDPRTGLTMLLAAAPAVTLAVRS